MNEAVLTDPRIVTDGQSVPMVRFQNGLVTDVDVVSKRDVFGMKNHHARFENYVLADRGKIGAIERAVAVTSVLRLFSRHLR